MTFYMIQQCLNEPGAKWHIAYRRTFNSYDTAKGFIEKLAPINVSYRIVHLQILSIKENVV